MSAETADAVLRRGSSRARTRRLEILTALEELFLQEGFAHLTVDDLARRLKCSKTTLYSVAPSREQLVVCVVKHFFGTSAAAIEASLTDVDEPRQRIATYIGGVGAAMRRGSASFVSDMLSYAPTAAIYRHNSLVAGERVDELIRAGVEQGVFRPLNAIFAARVVALALDGIGSGELLRTTGLESGDAITALSELIVHGLSA